MTIKDLAAFSYHLLWYVENESRRGGEEADFQLRKEVDDLLRKVNRLICLHVSKTQPISKAFYFAFSYDLRLYVDLAIKKLKKKNLHPSKETYYQVQKILNLIKRTETNEQKKSIRTRERSETGLSDDNDSKK